MAFPSHEEKPIFGIIIDIISPGYPSASLGLNDDEPIGFGMVLGGPEIPDQPVSWFTSHLLRV
jgi:hypothetical protein